jgi:hypothetical protein
VAAQNFQEKMFYDEINYFEGFSKEFFMVEKLLRCGHLGQTAQK